MPLYYINVGVTKGGDMLIVKEIHNQHNHDMSKFSYDHLPRQRKLDTDTQKDVRNMLKLKANKKLVQYELTSSTGKVVTMKCCVCYWNFSKVILPLLEEE